MPCDREYQYAVSFSTCSKDILMDSLQEAGMSPRRYGDTIAFTFEGQQATIEGGALTISGGRASQATVDRAAVVVKQNFSTQVVKQGAKKFGWTVQTTSAKNKLKIRHH